MITSKRIEDSDRTLLSEAIANDNIHESTETADFFYQEGTCSNVWMFNDRPVLFVRGKVDGESAVWLNIQFVDNTDKLTNAKVMIALFQDLKTKLKANGFTELRFKSDSPMLVAFCVKKFGFAEVEGELRRVL